LARKVGRRKGTNVVDRAPIFFRHDTVGGPDCVEGEQEVEDQLDLKKKEERNDDVLSKYVANCSKNSPVHPIGSNTFLLR
jgi:hypothetical protein